MNNIDITTLIYGIKNGAIEVNTFDKSDKKNDIKQSTQYQTASGELRKGTKINLRAIFNLNS